MTRDIVAAVVLSWNDADRVVALLGCLSTLDPPPELIVVIDNGSSDGSAVRITHAFPAHAMIAMPANLGFAAGVNRGIRWALEHDSTWVWLLNSDIDLPANALARLGAAARRDDRCGMAGALLVEADGSVQARGGGRINLWTGDSRHVRSGGERCDYLSGACLLLRSAMLRDIGLLDERYFFYWEDVDLAFRARDAGWSMAIADDCRVVHLEAQSLGPWSEQRWYHLFRGMRRFLRARAPLPRTAATIRLLCHSATMLRHGRLQALRGAWRAFGAELPL